MKTLPPILLAALILLSGACAPPADDSGEPGGPGESVEEVRQQIEEQIAHGIEATRNEDIDAYMEGLPEDLVIHDESGEVITREQQRANVLRDWEVITRTLDLEYVVDDLTVSGDEATVSTSQRWERMMLRPDRPGEDHVVTTQKHRETWRRTPQGWRLYEVEELGGTVTVNGEPYTP